MTRVVGALLIAVAALAAGVTSFFVVLRWLPAPAAYDVAGGTTLEELAGAALTLSTCAPVANCVPYAVRLDTLLDRINKGVLNYYAPGQFETYLGKGFLVLRRYPCVRSDIEDKNVAWSLWSTAGKQLSEQQERDGEFGRYHALSTDGHASDRSCLVSIQLPAAGIRRLFVSVLDSSRTKLIWKLDYRP